MGRLKFYEVDSEYLDFLQKSEIDERGFTKVPYHNYENNNKFVCGVVLSFENFNYYAPISSYSIQQKDNILIKDKKGKVKGSIRFNYMFPVPYTCLKCKDFSKEKSESYKHLLFTEYKFCVEKQEEIKNKAKRTYKKVVNKLSPSLLKNSCDFKLLEQKCIEYCIKNNIQHKEIEVDKEVAATKLKKTT
ncbi:type III toxin-antitoxin system ToxN/AbiQ family toxin [Hathewaya histolytica]|uniref:Type III toxin-antitoxin system ToxN/AbiQ family toxin n=1 Tax=Hathewaya histolytica TaxID=1498 RepID=A0A4U9R8N5_HATHI|nr:type III toxin-antitoxin system ToxN/AbiQ family toxin [Hathewaya histolytica]VTQ87061.1 Uncharacterised protein [Hathewaya histolytica]